ncbi:hypothetical protein RRG08_040163 [Elysia crispata]|uniref:Uncharacterized protein n=1 Tax=Elysia crispata TaxID=231223 RepID=A0AAE0XVZ9_9GAST|nr:hypothetical protein RRG08_040163 [Elysia crispata]
MAAHRSWQRIFNTFSRNQSSIQSVLNKRAFSARGIKVLLAGVAGIGSFAAYQALCRRENLMILPAVQAATDGGDDDAPGKSKETNYREMRFRHFASVEYDGNLYMTPQDFLESVTEESPRARIGRAKLSPSDVDGMLRYTPKLSRGSDRLFRKLHDKDLSQSVRDGRRGRKGGGRVMSYRCLALMYTVHLDFAALLKRAIEVTELL